MKKLSLPFFIILLLGSCSNDQQPNEEKQSAITSDQAVDSGLKSETDTFFIGQTLVQVEQIKPDEFSRAKDPAIDTSGNYELNKGGLVEKRGDTLIIRCQQRTALLVNNHSDNDESSQYTYVGYYPAIRQFIVYGSFWEWSNYLLVDAETADTTLIHSIPEVSPDGEYFVTGNVDLMAQLGFNGIALYKNTHKPLLVGERSLSEWGPHRITWADKKTLLIEGAVIDTVKVAEKPAFYRLRLN